MPRILVIEDEDAIRETLCDLLELESYDTISATNGAEGFDIILSDIPDLVICDVLMPKMNGYEVIEAIRNGDETIKDLPFIFLTSKNSPDDQKKGYALGANAYLTKPFSPDKLLNTIQDLLS